MMMMMRSFTRRLETGESSAVGLYEEGCCGVLLGLRIGMITVMV